MSVIQVRKFVIRREVTSKKEGAKPYTKAPKIQRLVTPQRLQHKRHRVALKRRRAEASKDAAVRSPPQQPYTYSMLNMNTERLRPDPLQAHLRGQGFARRGPQAPRFLHAPLESSSSTRWWRWWCHDTTMMKSRECFTFGVCVGRASCCLEAETSGSKGHGVYTTDCTTSSCFPNDTIALLHDTEPTLHTVLYATDANNYAD
jgi:hypothetical protein